jgi:hypothetical protein
MTVESEPVNESAPTGLSELTLTGYLRQRFDQFLAEVGRDAFEAGRAIGEKETLRRLTGTLKRHPTIDEIKRAVADRFDVSIDDMTSDRRGWRVAHPRQVAIYLARHLTRHSLSVIGRHFGGRDHTTVGHAIRSVEKRCQQDADLRAVVDDLRTTLAAEIGDLIGARNIRAAEGENERGRERRATGTAGGGRRRSQEFSLHPDVSRPAVRVVVSCERDRC